MKKIKRLICTLCAVAMIFAIPTASAAERLNASEYISTGNANVDRVIIHMFELPGYSVLQDGEIDVADEFFAVMTENYMKGDLNAVWEYMAENHISVFSPMWAVSSETSNTQAITTTTKNIHGEGIISVTNLLEFKDNTNGVFWQLDTQALYDANVDEVLHISGFSMTYDLVRHYGDGEVWISPDYATYSTEGARIDFTFGVDCGIALSTFVPGSTPIYLNLAYQYRADGNFSYTVT